MINKTVLKTKLKEFIPRICSPQSVFDLFRLLNYPENILFDINYKRKIEEFEFKADERKKIKNIYTILSFQKNLTVFLIESNSFSSGLIKYLAKVFSEKYDSVLLVITKDYNNILFVSPDYERGPKGKPKLKITKLYIERDKPHYTALEVLSNIVYEGETNWREIKRKWQEAFNVERVTEKFFEDYKAIFFKIRNYLIRQKIGRKEAHQFTLQLLNRIMFIYFIAKKRWLNKDTRFMRFFWQRYLIERNKGNVKKDSFYDVWLKQLFFKAFNNRQLEITDLPKDIKEIFYDFPYLNGGLFTENELDKLDVKITDDLFKEIFSFFEMYNFTIKEDMPLEREVAVDPKMIGYVYESLANVAEEIYDRNDLGIFYTPTVEVYFMCRRALVEYLANHLSEIPKEKIYEFVFDEDKEKVEKYFDKINAWRRIKDVLDNLSVVDPACGSGAFLVGMMNVLYELYKIIFKHLGRKWNAFDLKSSIISRSLYGVDVMPWAIHAAELRLWLQLIIETEFSKEDLKRRPLLPNLNLNLRIGDSLVQEIGGMMINLKSPDISEEMKKKLLRLKYEKENYFFNRLSEFASREDILKEEIKIFEEIIEERKQKLLERKEKIEEEIKRIKTRKQLTLTGKVSKEEQKKIIDKRETLEKQLAEIDKNLKDLEKIKENLKDPENKPFIWEIDFAEIFGDKGGFDIVIGNPPYVRQEKISPPNKTKAEVTLEDKRRYKEKLIESVKNRFPIIEKIDKKSDYYIYFYFHGLGLLNEKGVFCFITSNSWLDVEFGKDLQEFLLKYVPIIAIYDNPKRSFEHADINTIIALFGAPKIEEKLIEGLKIETNNWPMLKHVAKFVMFKKPFEEVLTSENLIEIDKISVKVKHRELTDLVENVVNTNDYRVFPILQEDLLEDGWEYPENYDKNKGRFKAGQYVGNKWGGKFLRAPEIFYTILKKGKGKLVRLGDIAEVRFGIKTGANNFFYLPSKYFDIKEEGNYYKLIPKQNGLPRDIKIEKEFLKPVIKSPRECKTIIIKPEDLKYKVFICNKSKKELKGTGALKYIEWGEKMKFNKVPTVRGRKYWYELKIKGAKILALRATSDRPYFYISTHELFHDQTFYSIIPKMSIPPSKIVILFNNSITNYLCRELLSGAHSALGLGALWTAVYECEQLLILDPKFVKNLKSEVIMMDREPKSIFEELGFDPSKPIREQEPNPLSDRAELDKIIFDALGLTEEERKEIYWAVAELVKQRLEKARSLKRKRGG